MAVVKGTKDGEVIHVLEMIDLSKRRIVKELTLDLSSSMMIIARKVLHTVHQTDTWPTKCSMQLPTHECELGY